MTAPADTTANVLVLFDRDGKVPTAPIQFDEKGKPFFMRERACGRCGGEGGSDRWAHTGFTCYDCNGSRRHKNGPALERLYTAEQIAKLNVSRDKVRARKAAKEQALRDEFERRAQENSAAFKAQHGALMERGWNYLIARFGWDPEAQEVVYAARGHFVFNIINRAERSSQISQAQVDALVTEFDRWDAEQARKQASQYVGEIGDKLTATVEVVVATSFTRKKYNAPWLDETVFIRVMRDEAGHTFKVMSPSFYPVKGSKLVISGKVKDHSSYNDERQTVLSNVRIKETLFKPEVRTEDDE